MRDGFPTRAGTYERQSEGFTAFIPAPLPPNPRIRFSSDLRIALSRAEGAIHSLNGAIQTLPQPDIFVSMFVRHEALLSSKIEGAKLTLTGLLAAEAQILPTTDVHELHEVSNHITTAKHGCGENKSGSSFISFVREIHRQLLPNKKESSITPGEFRAEQNWIGPPGSNITDAVFVPPPPAQVMPLMKALDQFVQAEVSLPPLVKIGLIHSQFATIHPFLHGNGRVNRLLLTLMLHQTKLLERPVVNLSWFISRHQQAYNDKLQSVRNQGKWEEWLLYFLRAVEEVCRHAVTTVRRILKTQDENRSVINNRLGRLTANGHQLLDRLYEFPFVSVNEVKAITGSTFASANALVARMVDCGLLREYTERYRHRRYLLNNYVELFKEQ